MFRAKWLGPGPDRRCTARVPPPSTSTTPRLRARLRLRGAVQAAAGATAGTLALHAGHRAAGTTALTLAAIVLLASLLSPSRAFLLLERGIARVARAFALVLTWTLLTLIYVLLFTPIALARRLRRRDPLARAFAREAPSYWSPRPDPAPGVERYEKQF
jgi:hypothetical protein